jgi:acetate kinase
MMILVLNAGSSTLKYKLYELPAATVVLSGNLEGIGTGPWPSHREALQELIRRLEGRTPEAVGHRVVHGGEKFHEPTLLGDAEIGTLRTLSVLAPLHNPAGLLGIETARAAWPGVPQVAVFDTAFHHTLPPHAFRYAVPDAWYREHGIRRYGFHGTSHQYVAGRAAARLGRPLESLHLITLHLGNGASVTAVRAGRSVDTSMGFTPLEGLVMGTRSGDLDPSVVAHASRTLGLSAEEIDRTLNRASGLLGLAGSNDMREVERRAGDGDAGARLALDLFAYRVKKYIGAYAAALGRLDGVVFTGGIGEHSARIRSLCLQDLGILGLHLDEDKNREASRSERELQAGGVPILVIPTDEEREIAVQTAALLAGR